MTGEDREKVTEIVARMRQSKSLLFITGAGLSADSNLPTYRGVGGLYSDDRTEDGIPIEVALSGHMFQYRPELTWRHIRRIEEACRGARHNRGHEVIAALERQLPRVWVLTQNVDGFHRQAGSRNLIEIHGDLHAILCTACHYQSHVDDYAVFAEPVPQCPQCSSVLRPDVVLFGEMLADRQVAVLERELLTGFDMVFSIGTSSLFPYIVDPVVRARREGIPTVEINPGQTDISRMVSYKLSAGAAESLEAIWQAFGGTP